MNLAEAKNKILQANSRGNISEETIVEILQEFSSDILPALEGALDAVKRMNPNHAAWSFSLPGGMVGKVNFSGDVERRHVEAFRKVFVAMADTWLETEA